MGRIMEPKLGNLYLFHHGFTRDEINNVVNLYTEKYGVLPTLLLVHSSLNREGWTKQGSIEIDTSDNVPQGHGWLGVEKGREKTPAVPPGEIKTATAPKHDFPAYLFERRTARKMQMRSRHLPVPRWMTLSMRWQVLKAAAPILWQRAQTAHRVAAQQDRQLRERAAYCDQVAPTLRRLYAQWIEQKVTKDSPVRDFILPDGCVFKSPYMVKVAAPIPGLQPAAPTPSDAPVSMSPEQVKAMIAGAAKKLHLPSTEERQAAQRASLAEQVALVKQMEAERASSQKTSHKERRETKDKGWRKGETVEEILSAIRKWKDLTGSFPAMVLVPEFRSPDLKGKSEIGKVKLVSDSRVKPGSFRLMAADLLEPGERPAQREPVRIQARSVVSTGL